MKGHETINETKTKQPSRTALKKKLTEARREIKKQKNLIAAISEQLRDLRNEIKRRDAATKKFREIEPRALIAAARIFGQWKAEERERMKRAKEAEEAKKEA